MERCGKGYTCFHSNGCLERKGINMQASHIVVKEIHFLAIKECKIAKKVNKHGTAKIVGIIKDEDEEKYLDLACSEKYIHVMAVSSQKKEKCIFSGIIENMEMTISDSKVITLNLITGTKLLDLKNRTRTFQDASMSYKRILKSNEKLNKKVGANSIFRIDEEKCPGTLITQYKETDWDFAIRMASNCNTCLIPACTIDGAKYYVGIHKEQNPIEVARKNITNLSIKKNVNEYEKIKRRKLFRYEEKDSYIYRFKSREIYEIGECLDIGVKKRLFVYSVEARFDGQENVNTYILRTAAGFSKVKKYNDTMIGASLGGKILRVTRDEVELALEVDEEYEDTGVRLFPYSTVYSSPDGTGWYCMPEIGDDVRLYFPTNDEKDAYVISAVHIEVSTTTTYSVSSSDDTPPRTEPSHKSFKNSTGKEIRFTPSKLVINSPGNARIELDDKEGITITSAGSIRFKADRMIEMHSTESTITMDASKGLALRQGDTAQILIKDENITFEGARMHLQDKDPLSGE